MLSVLFLSPLLAYLWIGFNGGNTLLFEDGMLQFFPFRAFLSDAFAHGFSPQWVPYSACGFSLLAEGQSGICFPSTQVIYRMFTAETGWLVEMISARIIAFALCVIFLRQLQSGWIGSLFGASVYAFCTATFGLENVPAIMWCHALLPGIFLSCALFLERRPFSFVCLSMLLACVFLTGHPVMMIYIGIILSIYFVFHWAHHAINTEPGAETVPGIGLRFLLLLGSILVATIIASPQLLPMLQEFRFSARTAGAGISLDVLQNSMHLKPVWLPLSLFPTPPRWEEWEGMSNTIRFPIFAIFLSLIGMLYGRKGPSRGYFVILGLFSVLMALGPYVGLWKLVHSLPVLRYFRFPYRWLFFLPVCISFLSARGIDCLLSRQNGFSPVVFGRVFKYMLLTVMAAGGVIYISYYGRLFQQTVKAMEYAPILTGLLWLSSIGMLLAAYLALGKETARRGVLLGAAMAVLSLFTSTAYNIKSPMAIHTLGTIGWKGGIPQDGPQEFRTSSALAPYDIWLDNTMNRHYPYTPNLTILNGTLSTGHYFSFFPYWAANVSTWCRDALNGDQKKQIYLDVSSAKWLFMKDGVNAGTLPFPEAPDKGINAYLNRNAASRASVVFSRRVFSDENALLAFMESADFDPRRELVVLGKDSAEWDIRSDKNLLPAAAIPQEAMIIKDRPDHIEIELKSAAAKEAFLVLNDTYYPGWKAVVDGVETKVLRANYAFRAVRLPEGARHIVFLYDPLIPDAALPLPTLFMAMLGVGMTVRHFRGNRKN